MAGDAKPMPTWYTIRDAADYLSVGEQTIYRWMRDGKLTYRKIGDSTRFLRRDLDAMVQVYRGTDDDGSPRNIIQSCQICGSTDLVDGRMRGTGLHYFQPDKTRFWSLRQSMIETRSKMCASCGHIALVADIDHLHQLRGQTEPVADEPDQDAPSAKG